MNTGNHSLGGSLPPGTPEVSVPDARPLSWRTERFDQAADPVC